MENNIGVGAEITIGIKIIPSFLGVEVEGEDSFLPEGEMIGRQLVATGEKQDIQIIKMIESFMTNIGVEGFKVGGVTTVYRAGLKTVQEILSATVDKMQYILGKVRGMKIFESIHKCYDSASDEKMFTASGFFPGFGKRKAELLFSTVNTANLFRRNIPKIAGFAETSMAIIYDGLTSFFEWMTIMPKRANPVERDLVAEAELIPVIMTGTPPAGHTKETYAKALGLKEIGSWKQVALLLTLSKEFQSAKMDKANEHDIPIYTYVEYMHMRDDNGDDDGESAGDSDPEDGDRCDEDYE
jgi:hypothetical protein